MDQLPTISIRQLVDKKIIPVIPGYRKTSISLKNSFSLYQYQLLVVTDTDSPFIDILNGEGKNLVQNIPLTRVKSNLPSNSGYHYFFICSETGRRCKKLHLHDGKFIHRLGVESGTYTYLSLSTVSKMRFTSFKNHRRSALILLEKSKPFYKSHYRGITTKKEIAVNKAYQHLQMMRRIYLKTLHQD